MGIKVQRQEDIQSEFGIDKIPIELLKEDPVTETYRLGTVEISKGEYANSEKINQIIDQLTKFQARLTKVENK